MAPILFTFKVSTELMQDDISYILEGLNAPQSAAVTSEADSTLVLAGAGSGKTRVLVHRIAWLVAVEGVSLHALMALTFTNKAASEMRQRISGLLEISAQPLWIGTFHGLAHRFLRRHWAQAGLPQAFQILDSDDQLRIVRRVMQALDIDEKMLPARQVQAFINRHKEEGLRASGLEPGFSLMDKKLLGVYLAYEQHCHKNGLVDFAELLLRAHETLLNEPLLLRQYQARFTHLLVDEFQDTNTLQYAWIRLLAGDQGRVFVVGDDDQSIYGWRGAKVENIRDFERDFGARSPVQVVRLEQNYRSSAAILGAANAIIANNENRLGKSLWTEDAQGELIKLYQGYNEQDEARFVAENIEQWHAQGRPWSEVAILYRSNAQSRLFEEQCVARGIPYRVYGGQRFFDRAEIKDALAYVRLMHNRQDDEAFERVVNLPARGIGEKSMAQLRELALRKGCSLFEAIALSDEGAALPARTQSSLNGFAQLIEQLDTQTDPQALAQQVELAIEQAQLVNHYAKEGREKQQAREENLQELVSAAAQFEQYYQNEMPQEDKESLPLATAFLANAALEAGEQQTPAHESAVQLMSLHSAKGLEFPLVFMVGMEEGVFPSGRAVEQPKGLEEERRLAYVGVTRAREVLVLTAVEMRRVFGQTLSQTLSRFVHEIPGSLLQEVRLGSARRAMPGVARHPSLAAQSAQSGGLSIGQRVTHKKFGEGVVVALEGSGSTARAQVNFDGLGTKWLILAYASLD